eukprot:m51a1_g7083 putative calcium-binding protein (260) ;mRNA; r:10162-11479
MAATVSASGSPATATARAPASAQSPQLPQGQGAPPPPPLAAAGAAEDWAGVTPRMQEQLRALQGQTNFSEVEVRRLHEVFAGLSEGGRKAIGRELFKSGLARLEQCGLRNLDQTPFGDRLFDLLDTNRDGVLDLAEFVTGLSLLCKGSIDEKLELCFKAYDIDGNGSISRDELTLMFKSAWISGFRALCAAHGNDGLSDQDLVEFAEEMATLFAENAFDTLDTNGDGQLSFEEFKQFALAEPKITATLNGFKKDVSITF